MKAVLVMVAFAFASNGCRSEPASQSDYVARITADRLAKDAAFKRESEPVPNNMKNALLPLVYYPPDSSYDVPAILKPSHDTKTLQMVYSDGAFRDVKQPGMLAFTLKGQPLQLAVFVEVGAIDANTLFLPFADLTNGTETYHGGRILEVERTPTGIYDLDFNRAYNPNCYFSPQYSCPIPPKENHLPIAIQAGERIRATK